MGFFVAWSNMEKRYVKLLRRFNKAPFETQRQMYHTLLEEMNKLQEVLIAMEGVVNETEL